MPIEKILFIIPSLSGGGAEYTFLKLLKNINRKKFLLKVITFSGNTYDTDIPEDIKIECLNKKCALDFFRLIFHISKLIQKEQPTVIISFLTYTNYITLLAARFSGRNIHTLISERNTLSKDLYNKKFKLIKKELIRKLYPNASFIITCSNGVKKDLCANFGITEDKCKVIYNPIDIDTIKRMSLEKVQHPWFKEDVPIVIACGRLSHQKNYPLLLKSIAQVLKKINVRLVILGDGKERKLLETFAITLGISQNVLFLGFQENPFKHMSKSTLFVLSSLYEGFPNVICEAMACGIPVISTNCSSGPDEIITNEVNGMLVPVGDEKALAEAILLLLKDESLRNQLAEAGRKKIEDFSLEKIVKQYEEVFIETMA